MTSPRRLLLSVCLFGIAFIACAAGECGCSSLKRQSLTVDHVANAFQTASSERAFPTDQCTSAEPSANLYVAVGCGSSRIRGGTFLMGSKHGPYAVDGEGPVREVQVKDFVLDKCEVSTRQFAEFVGATGYVTEAESFGWSFVFNEFLPEEVVANDYVGQIPVSPWWYGIRHVEWRRPEGGNSTVYPDRLDHPVVHVSWNDAVAFCSWVHPKGRLPTEAEWEFAARNGLEQKRFSWGDSLVDRDADGTKRHRMNVWQGQFPERNNGRDGYVATAPVKAYGPQVEAYELYNMLGNVWEWVSDWFSAEHDIREGSAVVDPHGPPTGTERVQKGGSFMCHKSYCYRYRASARTKNTPDSSASHQGFRCAYDV